MICRESGLLARPIYPSQIGEVFLPGQKPTRVCNLEHEPRFEETQHAFGQRLGGLAQAQAGRALRRGRGGGEAGRGGAGGSAAAGGTTAVNLRPIAILCAKSGTLIL